MREGTRTVVASLVAAMMLFVAVAAVVPYMDDGDDVQSGYFDRFPVKFGPGEKDYGTPEEEYARFHAAIEEYGPIMKDPEASAEEKKHAEKMLDKAYNIMITGENLFKIQYYCDTVANEDEFYRWSVITDAALEEYRAAYGVKPSNVPEDLRKEYENLRTEEGRVSVEYNRLVAEHSMVEYEGGLYFLQDPALPFEMQEAAARNLSDACGPLMLKLVENRNRQAEIFGYGSYPEYAFNKINSDDITVGMMEKLLDDILEMNYTLEGLLYDQQTRFSYGSADELTDTVRPFLREVDEEFGRLLDHLEEDDLIFSDPDPSKYPWKFTAHLPSHGSAAIYIGPPYGLDSLIGMIHEFGHASNNCLIDDRRIGYDIGEMHSLGLEMLAVGKTGMILPDQKDELALDIAVNLIEALISVVITAELELSLYSGDFETADDIVNEMVSILGGKNGMTEYLWCLNSQPFSAPFYMHTYVTACMTAMEILVESMEDWDSAADRYLGLLSSDAVGYHDIVTGAGFSDMFEGDNALDTIERAIACIHDLKSAVDGNGSANGMKEKVTA